MIDLRNYIRLSDQASSLKDIYISSKDFALAYGRIEETEKDSFLRHLLIQNVPYVFKDMPLLFEQIVQYLSDKLKISPAAVRLIGSGKTGYSISPPPTYGREFSIDSDLDFSIISEKIFEALAEEFKSWANQFEGKTLLPTNKHQELFWPQNLENCSQTIKRGFIDTYKIPSHLQFALTQRINESLFHIKDKLEKIYSIKVKRVSARVYKSWLVFGSQLKLNTESVLNQVNKENK